MLPKKVKLRALLLAVIILVILPFNPMLGAIGLGAGMIWFGIAKVAYDSDTHIITK